MLCQSESKEIDGSGIDDSVNSQQSHQSSRSSMHSSSQPAASTYDEDQQQNTQLEDLAILSLCHLSAGNAYTFHSQGESVAPGSSSSSQQQQRDAEAEVDWDASDMREDDDNWTRPGVKAKRKRASITQVAALTAVLAQTYFPTAEQRLQLAKDLRRWSVGFCACLCPLMRSAWRM
jgi:hypothetical protein